MSKKNIKTVDFDRMFQFSLVALKLNGAHPYISRDRVWLFQFLVMHGAFTGFFGIMVYNMYLAILENDFSIVCRHGSMSIVYVVISFKYFIITNKQKTINKIIDTMKSDYTKDMSEDDSDIVYEYAMKGRGVSCQWLFMAIMGSSLVIFKQLVLEIYFYVVDEFKLVQLYPLTYPQPLDDYKLYPVVFPLLYIMTLQYYVYAALMYLGFVPLGPIFMLHACGQLEIMKKRVIILYESNSKEEVEVHLKDIVRQMQNIYSFVENVKDTLKVIYELTLKGSTLIIPVSIYEVLASLQHGEFSIEFLTLIFGGIFISSCPCYYSDMLMEKGQKLHLAIYSCRWEKKYDHSIRQILLIMLLRTSQPLAIRTLFRTVSLDALADLFHQSYALFNLMNAAWG